MSYPLTIQALIVEDQDEPKEMYEQIFESLASEFSCFPFRFLPPLFVFSYESAQKFLAGSKMFHLVILDLRLPENDKGAQSEQIEFGQALLIKCLERERFPIPSLLVISGHIDKIEQDNLHNSVRNGFYHGRVFVKQNYELIQLEIKKACEAALRYCAVGVHLRDTLGKLFPTLSCREDDLLRRSVLQQPGAIGVDLSWWNAELESRGYRSSEIWKKVLIGRYLFADGIGPSRPRFFKFMPRSGAENVILGAHRLEQKLHHIKVLSEVLGADRALIVTEKVGASDERPISLEDFLVRPDCSPSGVTCVADQIINQLDVLGDLQPASKAIKGLFWCHHDKAALKEQWNRFAGYKGASALEMKPGCVEDVLEIMSSKEIVRFNQRSCSHGDLNISNIALDINDSNIPNAYIFDAGNNTRDVAGKDIAVLEVSALLHQGHFDECEFAQLCKVLYATEFIPDEDGLEELSWSSRNTLQLLRRLRIGLKDTVKPSIYSLMVLDYAAIQLEGLHYTSGNKVQNPYCAAILFAASAAWCVKQKIGFAAVT